MGYSNNPNLANARGKAVKEVVISGLLVAVVSYSHSIS